MNESWSDAQQALDVACGRFLSTANDGNFRRLVACSDALIGRPDNSALDNRTLESVKRVLEYLWTHDRYDAAVHFWASVVKVKDFRLGVWLDINRHLVERMYIQAHPVLVNRHRLEVLQTLFGAPERISSNGSVFVAAMQKSGSTFFCNLLATYLSKRRFSAHTPNRERLDLDVGHLSRLMTIAPVIQSHIPAGPELMAFLLATGVKPIVLYRNIFDCILSYVDHLDSSYMLQRLTMFQELDWRDRLSFTVKKSAYEYISFFASWQHYAKEYDVRQIRFEEARADWGSALTGSIEFLGGPRDEARARRVVEEQERDSASRPGAFRLTAKRGRRDRSVIPQDVRDEVRALYGYFPDADFSIIDDEWTAGSRPPV